MSSTNPSEMWVDMMKSWEDFFVQNNKIIMTNFDLLFLPFCELFCKTIQPQMREWLAKYSREGSTTRTQS